MENKLHAQRREAPPYDPSVEYPAQANRLNGLLPPAGFVNFNRLAAARIQRYLPFVTDG
jgi:hypothetical protein